jgi:hypothetical protein
MKKALASFGVAILIFLSCKKSSNDTQTGQVANPPSPKIEAAFVIDTLKSNLLSTTQELTQGIFKYNRATGADTLVKGDIFIEFRNGGYLRSIDTVKISNGEVILTTKAATLSDVFKNADTIKNVIPFPDNPFIARTAGANRTTRLVIPDFSISDDDHWKLEFSNLTYDIDLKDKFQLDWNIASKYVKVGLKDVRTSQSYTIKAIINPSGTGSYEKEKELFEGVPVPFTTPLIPVPCYWQLGLNIKVSLNFKQDLELNYKVEKESVTNMLYQSILGIDHSNFGFSDTKNSSSFSANAIGTASLKVELIPVIKLSVTKWITAFEVGIKGEVEAKIKANLSLWNSDVTAAANIFGTLFPDEFTWLPDKRTFEQPFAKAILFEAPKVIKSNPQNVVEGVQGKSMASPLKFKVFDSYETLPIPFVRVFFSSNLGKWDASEVTTATNGEVSNRFTFANSPLEHVLTATIKNADNEIIKTETIKITPTLNGPASVSIVSGNNQTAFQRTNLNNPLIVQVKDINGDLMPGANINWTVTSGGGQLSQLNTTTNSSGQSSNTWTLGATGNQVVTATVKKNDGTNVAGSPVTFVANISSDSLEYYKNLVLGDWSVAYYEAGELSVLHQDNRITLLPGGLGNWYETRDINGSVISHPPATPNATWSIERLGNDYILHIQGAYGRITPSQLTFSRTGGVFGWIGRKL